MRSLGTVVPRIPWPKAWNGSPSTIPASFSIASISSTAMPRLPISATAYSVSRESRRLPRSRSRMSNCGMGQAKSSRYQDFSKGRIILPDELIGSSAEPVYRSAASALLDEYRQLHSAIREHLAEVHPKPADMRPGAYRRTIDARAYDVDPVHVGRWHFHETSGRSQAFARSKSRCGAWVSSEYAEVRSLAAEMHAACAAPASCSLNASAPGDPVAPTLAKYADPDVARSGAIERVAEWARQNFDPGGFDQPADVDFGSPR